jgi:hypothetical protein
MISDSNDNANSATWAVTTLLIVVMVLAALYFGGILGNNRSTIPNKIDVDIKTPSNR